VQTLIEGVIEQGHK